MAGLGEWTAGQMVTMFCAAAVQKGLLEQEDRDHAINAVLEMLALDAPQEAASMLPLLRLGDMLLDYAVGQGLCQDSVEARDRFAARLFGAITPSPRDVRQQFAQLLANQGPQAATAWFYGFCRDNDYIRTERIAQNIVYPAMTPAGEMTVTINLSKPEKDPRDIAAARHQTAVSYPRCMLCRENPGYAGRPGFPARQNHRIIPLTLGHETWYLQYSPYLYYPEHCIVLNGQHVPMAMTRDSFEKMAGFVDMFPHYFIGSNADLPIVGGSILTHDHFQGGRHIFPMEMADTWFDIRTGDPAVRGEALKWPMTCLRFTCREREKLIGLMFEVLQAWRGCSDEALDILAFTGEAHNAVTPVMRKQGEDYCCYLLLRNNRCSDAHPLGIFHPHRELHHIKKENIGLIEAMGLFILPGRLKEELAEVEDYLLHGRQLGTGSPHAPWAQLVRDKAALPINKEEAHRLVRHEVGQVCYEVLRDTGVYKLDEEGRLGLLRFLEKLGMRG